MSDFHMKHPLSQTAALCTLEEAENLADEVNDEQITCTDCRTIISACKAVSGSWRPS